ncbi:tRNA methyltransferase 44 [Linnemannia hyalina]|uniref:tRNA (uracil-O(2)-)-methyltransferase n=1 Tax=Linnemannia hyalina TaxID=64524 RepID=A0A9P7XZC8_9FUNG|nr:tRNA methyltransferase 44 [Linnemannia hyalina]
MKVNEPVVEHVYTPTFYFDQLPNNNKHSLSQNSTTTNSDSDSVTKPTRAQWYRAAVAPVAFDEATFWQVLERWILEAPSIIPPISKVEILQTVDATAADQDTKTSMDEQGHPTNHHERELALLDGLVPFKSVRRQLIPKRADKDPVMEEQLYYCCDARIQEQDENVDTSTGQGGPRVTNQAIFAPIISRTAATTEAKADLKQEAEEDVIKILTEALPFYYPKVRGFRYGYRFDPEEAPEDKEDHHDDSHNRNQDDSEKDQDGQGKQGQGGEEKQSTPAPVPAPKKKHAPKNRIISRRTGWLSLDLYLNGDEGEFTDKIQYVFKELFKKLYKWGNNTTKGFTKSRVQHDVMVPKDLYLRTYARMKETHAQKWVKSWPERTDPTKFVFEDIAIAAWLVALWELERESAVADVDGTTGSDKASRKKQTFVDLGCGNGLLTHILNEEGHKGRGIDIVSRKVWDIYGPNTELKAETLIPNETMYEDVDWIIGNHADELAPWVPIIASRSKPLTRFVVIPCCFFDLNGSRKRKHDSSDNTVAREEGSGKGGDEEEDEMERTHKRVDTLVAKSGLFVARISDKEKQASQKAKQTAKVAKEATPPPPPPPPPPPSTLISTSKNNNTEDVQNVQ